MIIKLAHTQGFCAGVAYAIAIVDKSLEKFGAPLYVRHHIVHNTAVIEDFEKRGVVFVEDIDEVPVGEHVILSAHGVAPFVYEKAKKRELEVIDATCPIVAKIHERAQKLSLEGIPTVLIGHKGHQEIIGTAGYIKPELLHIVQDVGDVENLDIDENLEVSYLTQTTLSVSQTKEVVEVLNAKFPRLQNPKRSDICYATQHRQDAVIELAKECELVIICGSPNSSNSNRLFETAANYCESLIIDKPGDLDLAVLEGKEIVGISSGASVPRYIVDELVKGISGKYLEAEIVQEQNDEREALFALPKI